MALNMFNAASLMAVPSIHLFPNRHPAVGLLGRHTLGPEGTTIQEEAIAPPVSVTFCP